MKQIRYGEGLNSSPKSAKPVLGTTWTYLRPMQNDDGTKEVSKEKERVLAAISALKTQGADINPYTVSGEAGVPRSTLYRDPELMDLIYRERNGDEAESHLSNDEQLARISDLEASNQTLSDQIWELEKQLETMTKDKQDAYVTGFQAGIEEAVKRYGINTSETAARANLQQSFEAPAFEAPVFEAPAFEGPELKITEPEYEEPYSFESEMLEQGALHPSAMESTPETHFAEQALDEQPNRTQPSTNSRKRINDLTEPSGEFEPLGSNYDFGRSPKDAYVARNYQFGGGSLTAEEPDMGLEPDESVLQDLQALQTEPLTAHEQNHEILDDLDSILSEPVAEVEPAPVVKKVALPNIDFSLSTEREEAPVAPKPTPTSAKKSSYPNIDFGLSGEQPDQPPEPTFDTPVHGQHQPELQPAGAIAEVARDPEAIYNIARSGPTMSSSAYNPLVELSWKDLQTVYNFSVASLKDYAKPGFGNEQSPLGGTNFADNSTQQPPMRAKQAPPNPNHTADRLEPAAMPRKQYREDPRATGDKLQAMSDPRNLFETEPIVDLDALDIFDDLDDYVDLDKIEVISDVVAKPAKKEEPEELSKGGDELRELIKGRIKQAAEISQHDPAPRMTTPPSAAAAAAAAKEDEKAGAAGGARNKFVGGAKSHDAPPVAGPNVFVKQIPAEIRRSAMILGIKAEEATQKSVIEAWKKQIAAPGVHPDLGGDTEAAVFLNTAKDTMVRWLDAQAPKLGKKFGAPQPPKDPPKDPPKKP